MLALILFGLFRIFLLYTNPMLIVIPVVVVVVGLILSGNQEREEREKREREEAEQARIEKENKLLEFYLLCKRKGLRDPIAHPEEHERRERRKARVAQKERDEAAKQKRLANLVGKEKYLSAVEQQLEEYDVAAKTGDFLLKAASADLMTRPQKEDWAIAGGFADAIAGSEAALATVSEIQAKTRPRRAGGRREETKGSREHEDRRLLDMRSRGKI